MLMSTLATGAAQATESEPTQSYTPATQQMYDKTGRYDLPSNGSFTSTATELPNTCMDLNADQSAKNNPNNPDCHPYDSSPLTSKDVMIIGDSSWSAAGITQAGYNTHGRIFAIGGIGASNINLGINYQIGIDGNHWKLPEGNPGAILLIGSGNDKFIDSNTRRVAVENVLKRLRAKYPSAKIIMTDPISAKTSQYPNKIDVDGLSSPRSNWADQLMQISHDNGVTFIATKYWASDYGVSNDTKNYRSIGDDRNDSRHFSLAGHQLLAPHFKASWYQSLKGITLFGGIGQYSANNGGIAKFGVPLTNEFALARGGSAQQFSNDVSIYWTPAQQAHSVFFKNGIGAAYRAGGYENTYGYPQFDEVTIPNGAMQKFDKAGHGTAAFYWSKYTDTHKVWERGAIGVKFTNEGGTGKYGFPSDEETAFSYGVRQNFYNPANNKSYRIYWSQNTGAHMMVSGGAIFEKWVSLGHANTLGFLSLMKFQSRVPSSNTSAIEMVEKPVSGGILSTVPTL